MPSAGFSQRSQGTRSSQKPDTCPSINGENTTKRSVDMQTRRHRYAAGLAALMLYFTLSPKTAFEALACFNPAQNIQASIALEGLDPVMLTQGKEVFGNSKFAVTRGGFQYLFANEENRALFEKSPERYEIQLDGSCARMGPQVGGNPDLHSVYQGHIYIFGSEQCKKLFDAAPEKYLEPAAAAEFNAAPEAIKKGQALIERAVEAMGGAARVDGITAYQEAGTAV